MWLLYGEKVCYRQRFLRKMNMTSAFGSNTRPIHVFLCCCSTELRFSKSQPLFCSAVNGNWRACEQPAKWGAIENGQKLHLPKEMLREVAAEQIYSTGNSMQSQFNAT